MLGMLGGRVVASFCPDAPLCTVHLSPFQRSLLQVWALVRRILIHMQPTTQEELDMQALNLNSHVCVVEGLQSGVR